MKTSCSALLLLLLPMSVACGGDDTGTAPGTSAAGSVTDASTGGSAGSGGASTVAGSGGMGALDVMVEPALDAREAGSSEAPADGALDVPSERVAADVGQETSPDSSGDVSQETTLDSVADAAQDASLDRIPDAPPQDPVACMEQFLQDAVTTGYLDFHPTPSCAGNTPICCVDGGPVEPCGPIRLDLTQQLGDSPRLVITPVSAAMRDDVILRGRLKTVMPIPMIFPIVGSCGMVIDSTPGTYPDVEIDFPVSRVTDVDGGVHAVIGSVTLQHLEGADVAITGGLLCQNASLGLSFFLGTLTAIITDELKSELSSKCPG